jgi:hypothetical protein
MVVLATQTPLTQCMSENRRNTMLRLFAVAGFALAVTTSAQAITPAPIPQPDGMITQVRLGCGHNQYLRIKTRNT